jgi:receptor expression-enhancing protein 5/6
MVKKSSKEISLYTKWLEYLELIHQKTGIKGQYVIIGLLASVFLVCIGYLEKIITNIVGTVYPAYWTMKSIELNTDDDRHWLTYWVVFALFSIIDTFSGFLLKFIPFYFFIKISFLIWLFMPNSQGSVIIYNLLVVKLFKHVEKDIDKAGKKIEEYTKVLITQTQEKIEKKKNKYIEDTISNAIFESEESFKEKLKK